MFTRDLLAGLFFFVIALTTLWNISNLIKHWAYDTYEMENEPLFKPTLPRTMLVVLVTEILLFFYLFATPN